MSESPRAEADPKAGFRPTTANTASNLLSPGTSAGGEPVSPTSQAPASPLQSRSGDHSASDSETDMSQGNPSSPKSLPLKRGAWSPQEDEKLVQLVETMQPLKWVHVAQEMRSRTSKQCRERYHNYLKPSLTRTPISKEEGRKIEELVAIHGKRWAEISRQLPGRSDNAIKNWWNAGVNRRRASQDHSASNLMMVKQPSPSSQISPASAARASEASHKPGSFLGDIPPQHHRGSVPSTNVPPPVPPPVQPAGEDRGRSPSMHVPAPIQVIFSSTYSEPSSNSRMNSPMYGQYAPSSQPPGTVPATGPQSGPQPGPQQPGGGPPVSIPHHFHHNHHRHSQAGVSPYPLTPAQRAESRAESQARLSVASLSSMSRSNSIVEDVRSVSPAASPPSQPHSHLNPQFNGTSNIHKMPSNSSYLHTDEDPSLLFARLRQNSDARRGSVDSSRTDATSLSHYSLGNSGSNTIPNSRRPSVPPQIPAEMASPQNSQPPSRQSRLSIANLMNH